MPMKLLVPLNAFVPFKKAMLPALVELADDKVPEVRLNPPASVRLVSFLFASAPVTELAVKPVLVTPVVVMGTVKLARVDEMSNP